MISLSFEKQQTLQRMLGKNKSSASIAEELCIPRKTAHKIRVSYIQQNTKSLFVEQEIRLNQLSDTQLQRLKTLVSLGSAISTICSALSMEKINVERLLQELKLCD